MKMNIIAAAFVGLVCVWRTVSEGVDARAKRQVLFSPPLVSPFGGTFKLIFGIGVPISMPGRILVYGQNMQFQYPIPQNATFFTNYFSSTSRRRRRDSTNEERSIAYELLERESERWGAVGKQCMLRSICEAAETPLRDEGLVGELLHVLLTPDYGGGSFVGNNYLRAKEAGERGDDCSKIYFSCAQGYGILDRISRVEYGNYA